MSILLAITGAAGRMGRRIVALAAAERDLRVSVALEAPGCAELGKDAGVLAGASELGVPVTANTSAPFDVMIDFTSPAATPAFLDMCQSAGRAIVIGTTGHDAAGRERIATASRKIPVVHAPNMSVGVNVLLRVTRQLAAALDASFDVEITEAHHRFKADAPSGTAIALRDAVLAGRKDAGDDKATTVFGCPAGLRPAGQVTLHSLRLGDTVGEHSVYFGTLGETVTVSHSAHSRDTFAAGALRAARWISGKPAGLYSMQDVLFG